MPTNLVNILITITGAALIILVIGMYIRSRQGDQRVINVTNQMLLPILSIIVITVNILFANRQSTPACTGSLNTLFYAGIIAAILLIIAGVLRFFISHSRDRRLTTHPLLFSVIIVTIVFLITYLNGCL
jgi:uncharacterized membrane protein